MAGRAFHPDPRHGSADRGGADAAALLARLAGHAPKGPDRAPGRRHHAAAAGEPRRRAVRRRLRARPGALGAAPGGTRGRGDADRQDLPPHAIGHPAQAVQEGGVGVGGGLARRSARLGDAGPDAGQRPQSGAAVAQHLAGRRPLDRGGGDGRPVPGRRRRADDPERDHRTSRRGAARRPGRQRAAVRPGGGPVDRAGHRRPVRHHRQAGVPGAAEPPAGHPARAGPGGPQPRPFDRAGLRGLGCRRQGRGDPAHHPVAGGRRLPGDLHRGPDRGGAEVPLPVAVLARPAARRPVRHLRPDLVRPGPGGAHRRVRDARAVAARLRRDQRLRGPDGRARLLRREVLAAHLSGGTARTVQGAGGNPGEAAQDHRGGLPQPGEVGRLRQGGRPDGAAHLVGGRTVAHHPG